MIFKNFYTCLNLKITSRARDKFDADYKVINMTNHPKDHNGYSLNEYSFQKLQKTNLSEPIKLKTMDICNIKFKFDRNT